MKCFMYLQHMSFFDAMTSRQINNPADSAEVVPVSLYADARDQGLIEWRCRAFSESGGVACAARPMALVVEGGSRQT